MASPIGGDMTARLPELFGLNQGRNWTCDYIRRLLLCAPFIIIISITVNNPIAYSFSFNNNGYSLCFYAPGSFIIHRVSIWLWKIIIYSMSLEATLWSEDTPAAHPAFIKLLLINCLKRKFSYLCVV